MLFCYNAGIYRGINITNAVDFEAVIDANMKKQPHTETLPLQFSFGSGFLQDHAGHIMTEPKVAVIELIANAYDAGAYKVDVEWPGEKDEVLSISDDGIGMTKDEFMNRWGTLSYNRSQEFGQEVIFPPKRKNVNRVAFGRSGKGRHAAFCFGDSYTVETCKDGIRTKWIVKMVDGGKEPFHWELMSEKKQDGQGTKISIIASRRILPQDELVELIGSKFLVDPSFIIKVNGQAVQLFGLKSLESTHIEVEPHGTVTIHRIDSEVQDRTTRLRGIAWQVNKRMVGNPSWEGLDGEGAYLDGRRNLAKRYSFIVVADIMKDAVKGDWTGFHANSKVNSVREAVHRHVVKSLNEIQASSRKERKKETIQRNRKILGELTTVSRHVVGEFINEVQEKCPTISERDLQRTVEIFGTMEKARSGYDLLQQLEKCAPEDIDTWNDLMQRWTASNAEIVLNELEKRLNLIKELSVLVDSAKTDELHDLQPLFERGLWMFGPEYEAVDFRSNRGLTTIIRDFFGGTDSALAKRRPDFVCLPDSSIGVYGAFNYGIEGEISGVRKILIVELKKGGFTLKQKELDQARDYAKELRKAADVLPDTEIIGYVLGAAAEQSLEKLSSGEHTTIYPMIYRTLLDRAHSRTFNLQRRIQETQPTVFIDPEVEEVLASPLQQDFNDVM